MKSLFLQSIGFTLIELMITVAIVIVLSGSAMAAYYKFSTQQAAVNDGRNLVTELRKVQSYAKNMVYPSGCTSDLTEYVLSSDCSGNADCKSVSVAAVCGTNTISVEKNVPILSKSYFINDMGIHIEVPSGNMTPLGTFDLTSSDNYKVTITIEANGEINVAK